MKKQAFPPFLIVLLTVFLAIIFGIAMDQFLIRAENIILVFIATVIIIMVETKTILYGVFASIVLALAFNYFFTAPRYSLIIADPNYFITLILFMVAVTLLSKLTTSLRKEIHLSMQSERRLAFLYQFNQALTLLPINQSSLSQLSSKLTELLHHSTKIYLFHQKELATAALPAPLVPYRDSVIHSIENNRIEGKPYNKVSEIPFLLIPQTNHHHFYALSVIECQSECLTEKEIEIVQTALTSLLTAYEKEVLQETTLKVQNDIAKERLKSTLLRSISHDLNTPLTSLQTGTSFIIDEYDHLSDELKKELIGDVHRETQYLHQFVENLLHMTKLNAEEFHLHYTKELIDDLLDDLRSRVEHRLGQHQLVIPPHPQVTSISVDAPLFLQVLVNIVDNAIHHTQADATITIEYETTSTSFVMTIRDNGGGIPVELLQRLQALDSRNLWTESVDSTRRYGLGLTICHAIMRAHQGQMLITNNTQGGATFTLTLPLIGDEANEA